MTYRDELLDRKEKDRIIRTDQDERMIGTEKDQIISTEFMKDRRQWLAQKEKKTE